MKDMFEQVSKLVETNQRLVKLWQDTQPPDYDAQTLRGDADSELPGAKAPAYAEEEGEASTSHIIRFDESENIAQPVAVRFAFEDALHSTRVYTRTESNSASKSFKSLRTSASSWTQLTGLSLAQVSNISVIQLPICASDLPPSSSRWFDLSALSACMARWGRQENAFDVSSWGEAALGAAASVRERAQEVRRNSVPMLFDMPFGVVPRLVRGTDNTAGGLQGPPFMQYLMQATPNSNRPAAIKKLSALPLDQLGELLVSVGTEAHRRDEEMSITPAKIQPPSTLREQNLCDFIADLDFVLQRWCIFFSFTPPTTEESRRMEHRHTIIGGGANVEKGLMTLPLGTKPGLAIETSSGLESPKLGQPVRNTITTAKSDATPSIPSLPPTPVPVVKPPSTNLAMTLGIMGDACTGKSQLLQSGGAATLEDHTPFLLACQNINLDILDTGGAYEYRSLLPRWIEETQLFLLVFRPDLPGSRDFVTQLVAMIRVQHSDAEMNPILVFENDKRPLEGWRDSSDGSRVARQRWAEERGCEYVVGDSGQVGMGETLFISLARRRRIALEKLVGGSGKGKGKAGGKSIVVRVRSALQRQMSRDWSNSTTRLPTLPETETETQTQTPLKPMTQTSRFLYRQ